MTFVNELLFVFLFILEYKSLLFITLLENRSMQQNTLHLDKKHSSQIIIVILAFKSYSSILDNYSKHSKDYRKQ